MFVCGGGRSDNKIRLKFFDRLTKNETSFSLKDLILALCDEVQKLGMAIIVVYVF